MKSSRGEEVKEMLEAQFPKDDEWRRIKKPPPPPPQHPRYRSEE